MDDERGGTQRYVPGSLSQKSMAVIQYVRSVLMDPARQGDRNLRILGERLMANPRDAGLLKWFRAREAWSRRGASPINDPFMANVPRRGHLSRPGGLPLVQLPTSEWLTIDPERLMTGLTITGPSGSAKSTYLLFLLMNLFAVLPNVVVIILDRKKVFRSLAALLPTVPVTVFPSMKDLAFTLCCHNSPHVPREQIDSADCELLGAIGGNLTSHRPLLALVTKHGKRGRGFSVRTLEALLASDQGRQMWSSGSGRDRVLQQLSFFGVHLGRAFAYTRSTFLPTLFSRPGIYVFETGMLPGVLAAALAIYIEQHAYLERLYAPQDKEPPMVVSILDDFTTTLLRSSTAYGGGGPLLHFMEMSRQLRISHWLGFHAISLASTRLLQNTETKVICCARGEDRGVTTRLFGMTSEQFDCARVMRPGEVVVLAPSVLLDPVKGTFPKVEFLPVSDEYCRASAEKFRSSIEVEADDGRPIAAGAGPGTASVSSSVAPEPSPEEAEVLRVLRQCEGSPLLTLREHARCLGLSHVRFLRLVKGYEKRRYVLRHPVSTAKHDGILVEVVDEGSALLGRYGYRPGARQLTRGGHLHNVAAIALGVLAGRKGESIRYEVDLGVVRFDAETRREAESKSFVQIALSDPKREAEVLARAASLPEAASCPIVVVARDRKFADGMLKHLGEAASAEFAGKLEVRLLGGLLAEARAEERSGGVQA